MSMRAIDILHVEDDHLDAMLFSKTLAGRNNLSDKFHVTHCDNVEDATREDIEKKYDIVFLDMNLPGASGFDAIEKIKTKAMNIPIVVLTGNNDEILAEKVIKRGCQDYLVKGENDLNTIRRSIRYAIDRKKSENALIKLAHFDSLTQSVKREFFYEQVRKALSLSKRNDVNVAILFIDLDNFKYINDNFGHIAGDKVLSETAKRLKSCVRTHDTVSRFGGDEFVILLEGMNSNDVDCQEIAERIIKSVSTQINFKDDVLNASCSIGIATFPECGEDVDSLINNADTALQLAKEEGKNTYHFYTEDLNKRLRKKINLEFELREAIKNKEIEVSYQPIINLTKDTIEGVEALARWTSVEHGEVSPEEFISMSEKTGLIGNLGQIVLEKSCRDYLKMKELTDCEFNLSINVSVKQFEEKGFVINFLQTLRREGVSAESVSIEITESIFADDEEYNIIESLSILKCAGIKLHLDDFGTGYSSLGYLSKLPVDTLKIDRSFISGITSNNNNQVISKAIMGIAHNLDIKVISEGVENIEELNYLQNIGCDKVQGYYFARPMPFDKFRDWIKNNF